jgi:ribosome-associated protein
MEFKLKSDFIELDNLLKALDLVASGAVARQAIQAGVVKVNGLVESRIRRKLRSGDFIEVEGYAVQIVKGEGNNG